MAGLDQVLDDFHSLILTGLAPYQPNIPPTYPNPAPTAGTIVPTLVTVGHPIQYHVLARLENDMAQVAVYDWGVGKPLPFLDTQTPELTVAPISGQGSENLAIGRSIQEIVVEVWANSRPNRRAIADIIRSDIVGDYVRIYHADGTVTMMRFTHMLDFDEEQTDTIYVRRMHFIADYVEVQTLTTYVIEEVVTTVTLETVVES